MRLALFAALLVSNAAFAQTEPVPVEETVTTEPLRLSGPRLGVTYVTGNIADTLDEDFDAAPVITQFGWQFETRLFVTDTGLSGLTELVPLIGGLEQGLFLPSLSFLVGLRTATGFEFGFGPNASLAGAAYVVAVGATTKYGGLNIPVNLSAVISDEGTRLSFLFGFNLAR